MQRGDNAPAAEGMSGGGNGVGHLGLLMAFRLSVAAGAVLQGRFGAIFGGETSHPAVRSL